MKFLGRSRLSENIVIAMFAIAFMGGMVLWAENDLRGLTEDLSSEGESAVNCGELRFEEVSRHTNSTHTDLNIRSTEKVEKVSFLFSGKKNYTRRVGSMGRMEIASFNIPSTVLNSTEIDVRACGRSFSP